MLSRRRLLQGSLVLPAAVGTLGAPSILRAQDAWPNRQITLIVPFPPGGQADFAARPIAEALKKILGQNIVIENRGGAGGAVGNAAAARAQPDGYTLLMTLSSVTVLVEAMRMFGRTPTYEMNQFVPIARVLADPGVFSVGKSTPWKTLGEFIADAKKRPNEINYASSGNYGAAHVPVEMFAQAAEIKLVHVPYRGAGPAMNDTVAGQINATSSAPTTAKPQHDAGNIRSLAVFSDKRIEALPDVPTFLELGLKNVEYYIWAGLFVQAGTPEPVVQRLRTAMRQIMNDKAAMKPFTDAGSPPAYLDAPEFAKFIEADSARAIPVVRKIGKIGDKLE
jgi:tripartite-type tricarboxylate transporter receptor subunit TctC